MSITFLEKTLQLSTLSGVRSFEDHFFSAVKQVDVTLGGELTANVEPSRKELTAELETAELTAEV